jgi:hypothetical protein
VISNSNIVKELKEIIALSKMIQEAAAKLEEKLMAEGVSTPSKKANVNQKKITEVVLRRRKRIMNKKARQ